MGGQACVFYGAAEFSRDTDLAISADAVNLGRLRGALDELQAEVIAVPPFELKYLRRGHAIQERRENHGRCGSPRLEAADNPWRAIDSTRKDHSHKSFLARGIQGFPHPLYLCVSVVHKSFHLNHRDTEAESNVNKPDSIPFSPLYLCASVVQVNLSFYHRGTEAQRKDRTS